MSFFGWGPNVVLSAPSTGGPTTNPTTATLIAEIDLNSTDITVPAGGRTFGVTWIVSGPASTVAAFLLDHSLSTGVGSTGIRRQILAPVSSNQTIQLFTKHHVNPPSVALNNVATQGDRFRVRIQSSFTGSVHATIIAEPLV